MEKQVAVLIDGDNISAKYAEYIKQEAMQYGNVTIFRLYGSINSPSVQAWYKVMPSQGIMPVLQICYANGKSVADQALTIDAMDFLHTSKIDLFCIVSSDCDFTKLVYRIKECGKTVIGMGEQKTKEALAKACDEFKILDLIYKDKNVDIIEPVVETKVNDISYVESKDPVIEEILEEVEINVPTEDEIVNDICDILDSDEDDDTWVYLAKVGKILAQKCPGFDSRNYGYKNMTRLIQKHSETFETKNEKTADGIHYTTYIKKKDD